MHLAALERRAAPLDELQSRVDRLRRELEDIRSQEARLSELVEARPMLGLLSLVSRSAGQVEDKIRIEQLQVEQAEIDASREQTARLTGVAEDYPAVMEFVNALRDTRAFGRVELQSTSQQGEQRHEFDVECAF